MSLQVCPNCEFIGKSRRVTPGSLAIELVLWGIGILTAIFVIGLLILVGAVGYSVWRLAARHDACPHCGNKHMVSEKSPVGQRIIDRRVLP